MNGIQLPKSKLRLQQKIKPIYNNLVSIILPKLLYAFFVNRKMENWKL